MNYEALIKQFDELNAQMENARAAMDAAAQPLIESTTQQLFEVCPEIESVHWTQYTPYFNDGDSCHFSVHELHFILVGDTAADDYEGSYLYSTADLEAAQKRLQDAIEFETDSNAWRIKKLEEYRQRSGRAYPYNASNLRPYGSSEEVREEIEVIESFFERYSPEAINRINNSFNVLSRDLSNIPDEIMRAIYGDHVLVRIDRNGTTVEDYSHE
jgi:hypothetical protein